MMPNPPRYRTVLPSLCAAWTFLLAVCLGANPASAQTGTLTGRVFNPATGEYVRNAEVSIAGTNLSTATEAGGIYLLSNVPPGEVTVQVKFAGYETASAKVAVGANQTANQDINISEGPAARSDDNVIKLGEFVVSTEKEGNAKAIMGQRNSMNISRSVASDIFGDVTEGNVGEFLKYLPGVELEYVEADTRGPRIGGMDPEYAGVSIDGMKLASADAFVQYGSTENSAGAGAGSRSFGFEQVSINSIESIEINRVTSADMDADAPAGNINLKTKRAFDTRGRRIGVNLSTTLNSEEFHLNRTVGPNDQKGYKLKPNYSLSYSDTFLSNRLGILIGVSESNLYNEQYRIDHTYNRTPTASDPRPQVLTALNFKDGPKWTKRFTTTFTADYKASRALVLSLATTFNGYDARFYNRTVGFQAATNNTNATTGRQFASGDGLTSFGTNGAAASARTVSTGGGSGIKLTNSFTVVPRFEYRKGALRVDGAVAYSRSRNDYDNIVRGSTSTAAVNALQGVGFSATRSDPRQAEWKITQTAGADWANPSNYTNPRIGDDARFGRNQVYNGELNTRYNLPFRIPTFIKVGAKLQERYYDFDQKSPRMTWSYVGPGGNAYNPTTGAITTTGTYAGFQSPFNFDMGGTGGHFTSITGGGSPPFASRDALAGLYKSNPEYFVNIATPANFETAEFLNKKEYLERVTAGYLMANTRPFRQWQFQAGVRWEHTETISQEFDPLLNSQVAAAGFPVAMVGGQPVGNPTTIPGMIYKYTARPRVSRKGEYDNFFPSATAKYRINENLIADFGFGKTIKRPDINRISGVWTINEDAEELRAPNPNLKPELADRLVGALNYYFASAGNLGITLTQTRIKNLRRETDFSPEEFGITDPIFDGYTVITSTSDGPSVRFRTLELSYNQQLTFLPSVLRGTRVFATYTRSYASERRGGLTPHTVSGGVDYRFKQLNFSVKGVWQDEAHWTNTMGRYRPANTKLDVGASYKINRIFSVYVQGRNVTGVPHRIFDRVNGNAEVLTRLEYYGVNWTFGVKAMF